MENINFDEVVRWLVSGGSVALVSWFVSWLVEDFAWWQNIKSQYKKLIILGVALVIGIGAQFLQSNKEALVMVMPYLNTAVLVITSWIGTQVAHKADK